MPAPTRVPPRPECRVDLRRGGEAVLRKVGRQPVRRPFREPGKPFDLIAHLALDAPVKRARDARLEREHDPRPGRDRLEAECGLVADERATREQVEPRRLAAHNASVARRPQPAIVRRVGRSLACDRTVGVDRTDRPPPFRHPRGVDIESEHSLRRRRRRRLDLNPHDRTLAAAAPPPRAANRLAGEENQRRRRPQTRLSSRSGQVRSGG